MPASDLLGFVDKSFAECDKGNGIVARGACVFCLQDVYGVLVGNQAVLQGTPQSSDLISSVRFDLPKMFAKARIDPRMGLGQRHPAAAE